MGGAVVVLCGEDAPLVPPPGYVTYELDDDPITFELEDKQA